MSQVVKVEVRYMRRGSPSIKVKIVRRGEYIYIISPGSSVLPRRTPFPRMLALFRQLVKSKIVKELPTKPPKKPLGLATAGTLYIYTTSERASMDDDGEIHIYEDCASLTYDIEQKVTAKEIKGFMAVIEEEASRLDYADDITD